VRSIVAAPIIYEDASSHDEPVASGRYYDDAKGCARPFANAIAPLVRHWTIEVQLTTRIGNAAAISLEGHGAALVRSQRHFGHKSHRGRAGGQDGRGFAPAARRHPRAQAANTLSARSGRRSSWKIDGSAE